MTRTFYAATSTPSGSPPASGDETMPRYGVNNANITLTSGRLALTYFTATRSESVSQVRTAVNNVAAAGLTLARFGLYAIDGAGNGTLVAATANDTALWGAAFTVHTRALSTPVSKTAGGRYALGLLAVGTTMPFLFGNQSIPQLGGSFGTTGDPRISGQISALADLPASFTAGTVETNSPSIYSVLLP